MKRSEINKIIEQGVVAIKNAVVAPAWALWSPKDWEDNIDNALEFIHGRCGNDVTDFGCGDFAKRGLFLITCINGVEGGPAPYCRKLMVIQSGQLCPSHTHRKKVEHIGVIAGTTSLYLHNGDPNDPTSVRLSVNGLEKEFPALVGNFLTDGDTVRLLPGTYHGFKGGHGRRRTILEETSTINDDENDNIFEENLPRFSPIEEDVPAEFVLGMDIQYFVKHDYWPWQASA